VVMLAYPPHPVFCQDFTPPYVFFYAAHARGVGHWLKQCSTNFSPEFGGMGTGRRSDNFPRVLAGKIFRVVLRDKVASPDSTVSTVPGRGPHKRSHRRRAHIAGDG